MSNRPLTFGAFNQGERPIISMVNIAKTPLGLDFGKLANALQVYVSTHFVPRWGTPARVEAVPGKKVPDGTWGLVFADDADQPGALGYHELTDAGLPICYVFVRTSKQAGEQISVTASHEIAEMLVDPGINLWAQDPRTGIFWAYETADAVEATEFAIDGFPMSNFLYPSAFEGFRKAKSVQFDHLNKTTKPFQILKGGYSIVSRGGRPQSVFASERAGLKFSTEDRRMHRSELRHSPLPKLAKAVPGLEFRASAPSGVLLVGDLD